MIKKFAAVGIAAGVTLAAAGCGGGGAQASNYCVDQFGTVIDYAYCAPGNSHYNSHYSYWHDDDHHKYKPGKKIPSKTFKKGSTSTKAPAVTKKSNSSPAKPQTSSKVGSSSKSSGSKSSSGGSSSRSGKR